MQHLSINYILFCFLLHLLCLMSYLFLVEVPIKMHYILYQDSGNKLLVRCFQLAFSLKNISIKPDSKFINTVLNLTNREEN
jgi:hypothetical protein